MRILDRLLNQKCVYWPKGTVDLYGDYAPGIAEELDCKWQSVNGRTVTREGTTYELSAQVYLSSEVELDGWLWLGELLDAPGTPPKEYAIKSVSIYPDTENDETLYIAGV